MFSPPLLSDQTAALRGSARAAAARDAHHELRELPAAGLAVGPRQPGVGAQPLGRGRLGLLTPDASVEGHSREHRGRVVLFVNRFRLSDGVKKNASSVYARFGCVDVHRPPLCTLQEHLQT